MEKLKWLIVAAPRVAVQAIGGAIIALAVLGVLSQEQAAVCLAALAGAAL